MPETSWPKASRRVYKFKDQYFRPSQNYDPKVYENTFGNVISIIIAFSLFYFFNGLVTWAMFNFGIAYARVFTWYSVAIFVVGVTILIIMLESGAQANRKKRAIDFLHARISEKHAAEQEEAERVQEDRRYQVKLEQAKLTLQEKIIVEDIKIETVEDDQPLNKLESPAKTYTPKYSSEVNQGEAPDSNRKLIQLE